MRFASMYKKYQCLILFLFLFLCGGCGSFTLIELNNCATVIGLPGPEDMALDVSGGRTPRLIVSLQERRKYNPGGEFLEPGSIVMVPLENGYPGTPRKFNVLNRDDFPFHPHGIDLVETRSGLLLYVINHALQTNHSIEVFRVDADNLVFLNRLRSSYLVHPNDLVALADGQLYVSNDSLQTGLLLNMFGNFFSLGWSNVVRYDPFTRSWAIAVSGLNFANGVEVREDRLYVAATIDEGIHEYRRDPVTGQVFEKVNYYDVNSGVDNLTWADDTHLLVAAHPDIYAFLDHVEDAESHSPSEVYRVDVFSGKIDRVFADDGALIDASSTAIQWNNRLYISQVFDPELLHCSL